MDSPVATGSVAEPCHSDSVPVQLPTSYFPSYGAPIPYIILRNFKNKMSYQISVETVWKRADFNLELFILFSVSDPHRFFADPDPDPT